MKPSTTASAAPEPGPTRVMATISTAIRQPARADQRTCAACLLGPRCHTRAHSDPHFDLDKRTSRRIISQASLIMSNLRKKRRENVGCGYTNQTAEGKRE
jgi:hypothetical protein